MGMRQKNVCQCFCVYKLYSHSQISPSPFIAYISYSGKLSQEKTSRMGGKKQQLFTEKTFADSSLVLPKDTMALNFAEETFENSHKTSRFMKVLPLESFPLHGSTGGEVWEEGHSTHELVGKVAKVHSHHAHTRGSPSGLYLPI